MNIIDQIQTAPAAAATPAARENVIPLRVVGVGSAGANVIEALVRSGFAGDDCALAHTEAAVLARGNAGQKMDLAASRASGAANAGALTEASAVGLRDFCAGAELVCVIAGLGGRTGTEFVAPIAREAKAAGASVLAMVTLPFDCEGSLRQARAEWGLDQLAASVDGVLCLPNQKVFSLIDENTRLADTFAVPTQLLAAAVLGLWRMLARPAQFRVHLEDLCALLRGQPATSVFAAAEAAGSGRCAEVVERLVAHPLLGGGQVIREAATVLISVAGGPDMTMAEVNRVMEQLNRHCEKTQVILATSIDDALGDRLAVTLLASSARELSSPLARSARRVAAVPDSAGGAGDSDLGGQLLPARPQPRHAARQVPPAPEMSPEEMQRLLAKQDTAAGRRRKAMPRPRQTQLQLEIISKGRFDKSEPTIHKGEDLDLPTYVRRGVVLN